MPRQSHRIGIITHQGHRPRNRPTCAEPVEDIDANISFESSDRHHSWCFGHPGSFFFFFSLHIAGIYLFMRGFLLSRLSFSTVASCANPTSPCTLPPSHKRAVLVITDSPRVDFLSPSSLLSQRLKFSARTHCPKQPRTPSYSTLMLIPLQQHSSASRLSSLALHRHLSISLGEGGHLLRRIPLCFVQQLHRLKKPCVSPELASSQTPTRHLVVDRFHGRRHLAYCLSDGFPPINVARLQFFQCRGPTHCRSWHH